MSLVQFLSVFPPHSNRENPKIFLGASPPDPPLTHMLSSPRKRILSSPQKIDHKSGEKASPKSIPVSGKIATSTTVQVSNLTKPLIWGRFFKEYNTTASRSHYTLKKTSKMVPMWEMGDESIQKISKF